MFNLPTGTPLSFIYFGAAGIAAYFANDVEPLRWLAYAAAVMFFIRGPLLYVRTIFAPTTPSERARGFDDPLNVIAFLTLLAEWLGYAAVAYWLFKFAVAL